MRFKPRKKPCATGHLATLCPQIDVRSSVFEFGDGDFKTLLPAMTALTHLEFSIVSAR